MFSTSLARITHRVLALIACTGAVLALTSGPVLAAHPQGLTITQASWKTQQGGTLTVKGTAEHVPPNGNVLLFDADTKLQIGFSDDVGNNNRYTIVTPTPACSVYVVQDGISTLTLQGPFTVTGNPPGCDVVNNPPIANDDPDNTDVNALVIINVVANDVDNDPDAQPGGLIDPTSVVIVPGTGPDPSQGTVVNNFNGTVTFTPAPDFTSPPVVTFRYTVDDNGVPPLTSNEATVSVTVGSGQGGLTARGDSYTTPRGKTLDVVATRLSGVLYNDFDANGDPLAFARLVSSTSHGQLDLDETDGSFTYTPVSGFQGDDEFTYQGQDSEGSLSSVAKVNIRVLPDQPDFKFMMNYELGMHCTGFEFAYCCVLPVYNSIVSQIAKRDNGEDWPRLLEGDPNLGKNLDVLGRETVLRDWSQSGNNTNFDKYVVKYWHDAQSRNEGNMDGGNPQDLACPGAPQELPPCDGTNVLPAYLNTATLISDVEANSLLSWNTRADAADVNADNTLVIGGAECENPNDAKIPPFTTCAAIGVVQGNGDFGDTDDVFTPAPPAGFGITTPVDNYQNAIWNHLYVYEVSAEGVEGVRFCADDPNDKHCFTDKDCVGIGPEVCGDSTDAKKVRLGLQLGYPTNFGPGGHPMGPVSGGQFYEDNPFGAHLTFSTDSGTVVYTQMKLVENLPITLTSPRIWEALGLPLTPFEDTIGFFVDPGVVDEDSVRPYAQMTAQLFEADCLPDKTCTAGAAVLDSDGNPVQGFGTAPIDIPNCERCHSAFNDPNLSEPNAPNSPNDLGTPEAALVQLEIDFWMAYYDIRPEFGDSDWYARLKGAAISILDKHDVDHNTRFLTDFPAVNGRDADGFPTGVIAFDPDGPDPFDPVNMEGGLFEPFTNAPVFCIDPVTKTPTTTSCSMHADCVSEFGTGSVCDLPQNTRIGHESVLCHKCHADNVIAVVKSATCGPTGFGEGGTPCDGQLIPALTQALHYNHRPVSANGPIEFGDALGRDGGCQGCHPAHRSDGVTDGYPITTDGNNFYANGDNRLASGGCFVGRDVHSNPRKDVDGAETPEHLNVVGDYLKTYVGRNQQDEPGGTEPFRGIWCTNCHTQISQEMWKKENVADLINGRGACTGDGETTGLGPDTFCTVDDDCDIVIDGNPPVTIDGSCALNNVRAAASMQELADLLIDSNVEGSADARLATIESWLDPRDPLGCQTPADCTDLPLATQDRTADDTYAIWEPDAGLCAYVAEWIAGGFTLDRISPQFDGAVALAEVAVPALGATSVTNCQTGDALGGTTSPVALCDGEPGIPPGGFYLCGSTDADGDFTAALTPPGYFNKDGVACDPETAPPEDGCTGQSPFCTTQDCKAAADALLAAGHATAQIPFSSSTITPASDGRDHWLAPGEPHCADCHTAPFTENSGNIDAFAPFNYPRKASLMRYSRGHKDLTCQSCHESIHGLYPVTPTIDNTSYAQAASLNDDGSHGPLKCGACHAVDQQTGVPTWVDELTYNGQPVAGNYDLAVQWAHTATAQYDELTPGGTCENCHGWNVQNEPGPSDVSWDNNRWTEHTFKGRVPRNSMEKIEAEFGTAFDPQTGEPLDPLVTLCVSCHGDRSSTLQRRGCTSKWKNHLVEGRASESVWQAVTDQEIQGQPAMDGTYCGW